MTDYRYKRVFILGAGFSKATGMPLATDLAHLLIQAAVESNDDEKMDWLNDLERRLKWLTTEPANSLNVEELFHYAVFDMERWKMKQHLAHVERGAGPCTPYGQAEMIDCVLREMESELPNVIWREQQRCESKSESITKLARHLRLGDAIVTFNYDTLIETALSQLGIPWHHGLNDMNSDPLRVVVLKMHGSVDWLVIQRSKGNPSSHILLFSKLDLNARPGHEPPLEESEYHSELWRVRDRNNLSVEIEKQTGLSRISIFPGIAGLGAYKPLGNLPGSGMVWQRAENALWQADEIYVIGFSMSPFDAMSRLLVAEVMRKRKEISRPPRLVRLIDPNADKLLENYLPVFQVPIIVDKRKSEDANWTDILDANFGE